MEREELYIKYRLYFSKDVIDSFYNELEAISKLIRYNENLGNVVDRYLSMLQKLKQCEEEQNEIANRINNIHKSCLGIKREGVSMLQSEGKLISLLDCTLDIVDGTKVISLKSNFGVSRLLINVINLLF